MNDFQQGALFTFCIMAALLIAAFIYALVSRYQSSSKCQQNEIHNNQEPESFPPYVAVNQPENAIHSIVDEKRAMATPNAKTSENWLGYTKEGYEEYRQSLRNMNEEEREKFLFGHFVSEQEKGSCRECRFYLPKDTKCLLFYNVVNERECLKTGLAGRCVEFKSEQEKGK